MLRCDLCGQEGTEKTVQQCAFGEKAVDLLLHLWCQQQLLDMNRKQQDAWLLERRSNTAAT
jgi:hypothetical protein